MMSPQRTMEERAICILEFAARRHMITICEIEDHEQLSEKQAFTYVRILCAAGWLKKVIHEGNKTRAAYSVTPAGRMKAAREEAKHLKGSVLRVEYDPTLASAFRAIPRKS